MIGSWPSARFCNPKQGRQLSVGAALKHSSEKDMLPAATCLILHVRVLLQHRLGAVAIVPKHVALPVVAPVQVPRRLCVGAVVGDGPDQSACVAVLVGTVLQEGEQRLAGGEVACSRDHAEREVCSMLQAGWQGQGQNTRAALFYALDLLLRLPYSVSAMGLFSA